MVVVTPCGQVTRWLSQSVVNAVRSKRRCCVGRMPAGSAVVALCLDGAREFGESHWKPVSRVDIHIEFVVASAEVLDEGVSRADYSC
jgi:hypothetical protein